MIELLVVIAIITILFAIGVLMSMDAYRGYSRRSERDTVVSILQRARSSAISNVNQHQWGACYDSANSQYVIFAGASYAAAFPNTKQLIPVSSGTTIDLTGAPAFACSAGGIIFAQLTGNTSAATISMTQGAITSTVSTNAEGRINW